MNKGIPRFLRSFVIAAFLASSILLWSALAQKADDKLLERGIRQFRQESYDEALETFKQVVDEKPKSWASASQSMGKALPANADAPSGSTATRFLLSSNRCRSRCNIQKYDISQ